MPKASCPVTARAMRLQTNRGTVQFRHTGGTRRGAIARDTPRHVRSSHRQLVRRARGRSVHHSGLSGAGDVSGAVLGQHAQGASCWEFRKRGAAALFAG